LQPPLTLISLGTVSHRVLNAKIPLTITPAVERLAAKVAEGAERKGYLLCVERTRENGSGIVSIRKPDADSRLIVRQLKEQGFLAARRQGWIRVSPHCYIGLEEIDRLLVALP
jgi:cysteine desulfurase / selenocysteine lyase